MKTNATEQLMQIIDDVKMADAMGDIDKSDAGEVYDWVKSNYGKAVAGDKELMKRVMIEVR